jgi:hypothetical protein
VTSAESAQLRRPRSRGLNGRVHVGLVVGVLPLVIGIAACSAPPPTVSSPSGSAVQSPGVTGTSPSGSAVQSPGATGTSPSGSAVQSPGATGTSPSGSATPAAAPALPGVSAAVEAALQALLASSPQPSREQIRGALTAAGFAPAAVEVSASRTPTGLAADAVDVGVLGGNECVMAQLRSGTVATSVLPVLPNGRCFVGSVQR